MSRLYESESHVERTMVQSDGTDENKLVEWIMHPMKGQSCREKFHGQEFDRFTVYIFQEDLTYDAACIECYVGDGNFLIIALPAYETF